jgi:hypothetical protein
MGVVTPHIKQLIGCSDSEGQSSIIIKMRKTTHFCIDNLLKKKKKKKKKNCGRLEVKPSISCLKLWS